jgi:hypothetical protein
MECNFKETKQTVSTPFGDLTKEYDPPQCALKQGAGTCDGEENCVFFSKAE